MPRLDDLLFLLLGIVQLAAFGAAALFCLARLGQGRWALLGALGGLAVSVNLVLTGAAQVTLLFGDSSAGYRLIDRLHLEFALALLLTVGVVLVVLALVDAVRTQSPDARYGQQSRPL